MKYLLDTCIISELSKKTPNNKVIRWIKDKHETDLFMSVLTLGEIQKGITKLEDSKKKRELVKWIESDLPQRFEKRILPVTDYVSRKWGEIQGLAEQQGNEMPVIDSLIAATGLTYNLEVITRNTEDMKASGVQLFNPWVL